MRIENMGMILANIIHRRHDGIMKTTISKVLVFAVLVALGIVLYPQNSQATFLLWPDGVNHSEIDWKYTETEHFRIYWYPEVKYTARQLVAIAEDIYDHDSKLHNYECKDKIIVVVLDTEDYANGFAAHNFNWITVWASHLYGETRGRVDWLADVFSHELGHIITLKAGSTFRENMYGILIGGSRNSRKYNFDVGAGFMFATETLPTWMVEGVAQYTSMTYGADPFDTHREMLLRMATLEDHLLTMDQMDIIYDKNSLQAEMVYNQGFAMNAWIGETWGLDAPARMWHETGVGFYPTYNRMLKKELGLDRIQLYNQWKAYLIDKYNKQTEGIRDNETKGFKLKLFEMDPPEAKMNDNDKWLEGISNYHVQYSPDGEYIALASSHGTQRRGTKIHIKKVNPDPEIINDSKIKKIAKTTSRFSWSPDSQKIVYATHGSNALGYYYSDLWVYDIDKETSTQITHDLRAQQPVWSPNEEDSKIAFAISIDGQMKLAIMRYPKISGYYYLVNLDDATQIGHPVWSPDGSKIAILMYRHKKQDIWVVNSDGTDLHPVTYDNYDNRDPAWMDDNTIVFSSDRTGIFNLYKIDTRTHELNQLTNVLGGAFYPNVKSDGSSITYSYFTSWGYRPYEIPKSMWMNNKVEDFEFNVTEEEVQRNLETEDYIPEISYRDYSVFDGIWGVFPILKEHRGVWVWIPMVLFEDNRLNVGVQVIMVDAVERNLVFAYVEMGEDHGYHMFYENYMLPVTGFLSLHKILPSFAGDYEFFDFDVGASLDATIYFIGLRYTLFKKYSTALYYKYFDIRVEQPSLRRRYYTSRSLNLSFDYDSVPGWPVDSSINPRGGTKVSLSFEYANPSIKEPFTGTPMGSDMAGLFSNPAVINRSEANQYPDENFLVPDYGFWKVQLSYKKYLAFPFWDMKKLNDVSWLNWGFDWSTLNFERWKRQRHSLIIKFSGGYVHSTIPEGYGWGNSYGRTYWYDRFHGGGMYVSGANAYSDNGAFLGYEGYSLSGETMAILGFDYRFPLIRDIDAGFWAFYFDNFYMSLFYNVGNFWAHVNREEDLFNLNRIFDKNHDGKFTLDEDLIADVGVEFRLTSFLFASGWDSFIKIAHGFRDNENDNPPLGIPLRFYFGLGTGFDD